ncbi:MAG TPA: hypothetical protein ENN09_07435 [Planctomycetes bacterium]|nr:hypothetical protein [Planctomycetota bacterium]
MPPLNVLLITSDQLRYDAISTAVESGAATPSFDRLAREGVFFERAYTPCPICVPARVSITTGNYPHFATGTKNNSGLIHDNQPRIAHHFNDHGYETYAIGKLHYVPYAPPGQPRLLHGFKYCELHESGRLIRQFDPEGGMKGLEDYHDYLYSVGFGGYERAHWAGNNEVQATVSIVPEEHYVDTWITDRSIAALDRHLEQHGDMPFFMWTSYPKPHSPYDPPTPWAFMYDPRKVPPPAGCKDMLSEKDPFLRHMRPHYLWDWMPPQAVQASRARYWGLVSLQDSMVGRLLDFLEEKGLAQNTIVIYTTDHGDLLGDFGCFFKSNFLEGSARIPFIWRVPGMTGGIRTAALAGLQDILPTLAALTGADLTHPVHGLDLSPALRDGASVRDVYVSQVHDAPGQCCMITDGRYKYIYNELGPTEELYDLQADPQEKVNLVARGRCEVEAGELQERLVAWIEEYGDHGMIDAGGELVRRPIPPGYFSDDAKPGTWGRRWF